MWITTFDGLNRYDGSSIKVYRHDPDDPNSLSHNVVRLPIVDQNGVLWIGTFGGGLNQYDVEKDAFIRYQHDPDDPHSLSNDIIRSVYEDQSGTIWVGTNEGLNKLNRDSKQFTRFVYDPDDESSLSDNTVLSVLEDSTGVFWIGTADGVNRFDPITEQFIHYGYDPDDPTSNSHKMVRSISEDGSGALWMGTSQGLCALNPERTHFTCYQHDAIDPRSLSNNTATAVYVDPADVIWVGTWGGGLNRFDRNTESFIRYEHRPTDPFGLSSNSVVYIYGDRLGMLWLSTDGGVTMLDGRGKAFYHYRTIPDDPNSLSNNEVRTVYVDQAGGIWVGTNGGGLSKFDRHTEEVTHYRHEPDEPDSLLGDAVWAIYEDQEGMIWVGSYGSGLSKFNPDSEQFVHYQHDPDNPRSLSNDLVSAIYEDRSGNFWVGTENGLNRLDGDTFRRYEHDPNNPQSLSSNFILTIYEDRLGELWIGTASGLNRFSPEEGIFTRYHHDPADPASLGSNSVVSMLTDRTGTFWIGTLGGLDKFDRKNEQFSHYTTKDGLPSDTVYGILEDEQGALWLSTTNGLSRFDPRTESFRNYDGRFLAVNQALTTILRTTEAELLKRHVSDVYVNPDRREMLLRQLREEGTLQDFTLHLIRDDGSTFYARLSLSQITADGKTRILAMVDDLTEQILAEHRAAVLEERERLARELHDALTQTLFSASLLADTAPRLWAKDQSLAVQNLHQLGRLLRGALAEMRTLLYELRPGAMQDQTLGKLFEPLADIARARTRATVDLSVAGDRQLPEDINTALFRIAQESLNNVAKHAEATQVGIGLVMTASQGIVLCITDDGRGFDPAAIPAGHFGIGIMAERAAKIGAEFKVESKPGEGTEITVAWTDPTEGGGQVTEPEIIKVMLVDDHPIVRDGLKSVLLITDDLVLVGEAGNGHRALAKCREVQPDVILMDIVMPGMDGLEATRAILSHCPDIKIVVLTNTFANHGSKELTVFVE